MEDGVSRKLVWNAPELYEWLGRSVELYFDPLAQWPLEGVVVQPGTRRVIGSAICQNPYGESRDADRERVAAIRRTMLSDLRIILGGNAGARRTTARGIGGTIEINTLHRSGSDQPASSEPRGTHDLAPRELPHSRAAVEPTTRTSNIEHPTPNFERKSFAELSSTLDVRRSAAGGPSAEPLRSVRRKAAESRDLMPNW
jgi:hypothetical protein